MTETNGKARGGTQSWGTLFKVCIVGASSLKGRELKDALEEYKFPTVDVKLLDDDESMGQLEAVNDEATFIQAVSAEQLEGMDIVFFASEAGFTRKTWQMAKAAGCAIVDMSYAIDTAAAKYPVRSVWLERERGKDEAKTKVDIANTIITVAHPAAVALGLILMRLEKVGPMAAAAVTIFEPVSERGKAGMDELHQQTLNLLSIQSLPKTVFDAQVAFNMLDRYGEESKASLQSSEALITRHLMEISLPDLKLPAMQLLHAPTFHGYIFSLYVELEKANGVEEVKSALAGEHVKISAPGDESPSNVSVAGEADIQISVRPDMNRKNGVWIWAAIDNLKIQAMTALDCGAALAAGRPSDKIQ